MYSPQPTLRSRSASMSSLQSLDSWIESYVPLSNLPTPPPSRESWSPQVKPAVPTEDLQDGTFISPSIHLANMIPKPACSVLASPLIIQAFLSRSGVQMETIAFAACILDRLSDQFALRWRRECPLAGWNPMDDEDPFTAVSADEEQLYASDEGDRYARPEVIALASVMLAQKFLDDYSRNTPFWAQNVSGGRFTFWQVNTTERLILSELGFRIHSFCTPSEISTAMRALRAAGKKKNSKRFSANNQLVEGLRTVAMVDPINSAYAEAHVHFDVKPCFRKLTVIPQDTDSDETTDASLKKTINTCDTSPSGRRAFIAPARQANQNLFLRRSSNE